MLDQTFEQKKILIAEDNELNMLVITRMLAALGHSFDTVNNGMDCLQRARQHSYDLILTDISMPGMDGLEVAREIRTGLERGGEVPIVAVTANADVADYERFEEAGISEVLPKPFGKAQLQECTDRWL